MAHAAHAINVPDPVPAFEGSTLDKLQGLTEDVIERLEDEGITSSVHLAYTDPIRLFLRTNFEWPFLIDVVDQALIFNYLRDIKEGPALLRPLGIRGSIEMVVLGEALPEEGDLANPQQPRDQKEPQQEFDPRRVRQAIAIVARKLGEAENEVRNLAINLWEDGQVDLIWELFKAFEKPSQIASTTAQEP